MNWDLDSYVACFSQLGLGYVLFYLLFIYIFIFWFYVSNIKFLCIFLVCRICWILNCNLIFSFFFMYIRQEGWRNTWRGSMPQNIGCLISLVVPLYVHYSEAFCHYYYFICFLLYFPLNSCIQFDWLYRHQSHPLDLTNQGSACLWSLSCETD